MSSKFFQVRGPRERLGIFSKSPGHFLEEPFLECDVIKGGGGGGRREQRHKTLLKILCGF